MQSFVYDTRNNVTGVSETETADATGASGFDALKSGSPTHAYGMAYDASNRVTLVQQYAGAQLTGQWRITRDSTGNVFAIILQQEIPEATEMISRDAAHRVINGYNPISDFLVRYDRRGRIDRFYLQEYARPENGGIRRVLEVTFRYSPDGRVISRAGTVAKNGSMLDRSDGSDIPISREEIDQWLDNYNFGEVPIGPPANLQGARQLLLSGSASSLGSVCGGCHFEAGLPDGILRGIALVWRLSKNPVVQYGIGQGRQKAADAIQRLKEMCKPVVKDTTEVNWGQNSNQIGHTFRHLDKQGIPREPVMNAIQRDIVDRGATLRVGDDAQTFSVMVDGRVINYVAYRQSASLIRVGSIRPQ